MNLDELGTSLKHQDVRLLSPFEGELEIDVPEGMVLPDEVMSALCDYKAVLIAMLPTGDTQAMEAPHPVPVDRLVLAARGDKLRAQGLAARLCWLPLPQERVTLPPLPGKPEGEKLWFE